MAALSSSADGERGTLRGEVSKLEGRVGTLQADLEAKKKEAERAEGVCTGLKTQVGAGCGARGAGCGVGSTGHRA